MATSNTLVDMKHARQSLAGIKFYCKPVTLGFRGKSRMSHSVVHFLFARSRAFFLFTEIREHDLECLGEKVDRPLDSILTSAGTRIKSSSK